MAARLSRFWLWTVPLAIGVAAAAVFGFGFVLALRGSVGEPIGEPPPPPAQAAPARPPGSGAFRILVLGDSLAKGTGDETGKGFAVNVLEAFRAKGPAELTNLGVNGMESPEVRTLVETPNVRTLAAGAGLILVSAGGNDLTHGATRGGTGSPADVADAVAAARGRYVESLRAILTTLREANPTAPICVIGLYDPFGKDAGPGRLGASIVLQWNALASETALAFPNVFVVPTFDIFQGRPDRLGADRYHPSAAAYGAIAARVMQVAGDAGGGRQEAGGSKQ